MAAIPAKALNDLFFEKVGSTEGKDKIAELGGTYIRDRLREVSFARKIVPPTPVQRTECQRSVNHDTLVKIVDIEPNSKAMSLTFRGQPTARFIRAPRYEIPFFTISSEKFEKTEQELLAYEMPITKIIEENSVKDIQAIEDRVFLIYVEACVQAYQVDGNGGTAKKLNKTEILAGNTLQVSVVKSDSALQAAADDFTVWPVLKNDFIKLKQILHRRFLRAERILITEPDYDNLSAWTIQDVWSIAAETATEGWKANTVVGLKIIRTIKTDILREGNVYCFTAPEFFGRFYILNQTKFYIDKIANLITWQSWEDIGMGFGNVASVVKLECYSGSVTPGNALQDVNFATKLPQDEADLGPVNNKADSSTLTNNTVPQVDQF